MSRSPRRNLRLALDALDDLAAVCEQHPDAKAEVLAALGETGFEELMLAHASVRRLAAMLERSTGGGEQSKST